MSTKPFVLPPLQSSTKDLQWCSQVVLSPSPPSDLVTTDLKTSFPSIENSKRWRQELQRMEAEEVSLDFATKKERLEQLEMRLRSVVCGRKHEKHHQLLWHYQKEKAKVERETAVMVAKAVALQRAQYMEAVHTYKARGHVQHLERVTRNHMLTEEEDARRHITSLLELALLEDEQRQRGREAATAQGIAEDLKGIRDWESEIAEMSFRGTKAFSPETELICERNVGTGGYRGRNDLLMDYSVCEEERHARVQITSGERIARMPLECELSAAKLSFIEESNERRSIEEMCLYGSCQARLRALLRIQRWWRMLRVTTWKERKWRELKKCLAERRKKMTSADYRNLLHRMKRQMKDDSTPMTAEEAQRAMAALERAAEMSYQYVFDYAVYSLMNDAFNLQETEAQNLRNYHFEKDDGTAIIPPVSTPLRVPYRLYVRKQPLQPYPLWRALRWIEGSTSFVRQVKFIEEEEAKVRNQFCQQETSEVNTLQLYQSVLKKGAWMWRSFYTSILCILEEENVCRGLLSVEEQDTRTVMKVEAEAFVSNYILTEEGNRKLLRDEEEKRCAIDAKESDAFLHLTEGGWRWANLARLRKKLRDSCGGQMRWIIQRDHGFGQQFVSLDTTACVIQRFFRVSLFRKCLAEAKARRLMCLLHEKRLKEAADSMVRILEEQHNEKNREEMMGAKSHAGDWKLSDLVESYIEMAVVLFSEWFDERAHEPMERQYKAIVARFMQANRGLYKQMHALFAVTRNSWQRIEEEEARELSMLKCSKHFVAIALGALCREEATTRQQLETDAEQERYQWYEQAEFLASLARCATTRKMNDDSNLHQPSRRTMNHMERLESREEVVRTRILVEERRERSAFLLSLHTILRDATVCEEQEERAAVHADIDACWMANSPDSLLVKAEEVGRRGVEAAALSDYGPLLHRAALMYAQDSLFVWFLRGHMSFESEAKYFDRRLTKLLLQRVSHLGSKMDELIAAETCARARVEYFEETKRELFSLSTRMK